MSDQPDSGRTPQQGAPVRVHLDGEPFAGAARRIAAEFATEMAASRLADGDPSVWGPSATHRLGWVHLPRASRPLAGQVRALREKFLGAGAHRVLLVGAPAVTAGARALAEPEAARLRVLDGADPAQVADALAGDLDDTVLVVADAAGNDPVVAAVARIVGDAIVEELSADPAGTDADDPVARAALAERTVYLTEPGSALDVRAIAEGSVVITVDADVPERFSALGPFGLVPAGLAGVDVDRVLAGAAAASPELTGDEQDNPALLLAGALVAARESPLVLRGAEDSPALSGWIAQLVSGSRGPLVVLTDDDTGLVPPVAPSPSGTPTVVEVFPGRAGDADEAGIRTVAEPGAGLLLWQVAVAVAARRLDTDPFAPVPAGTDPGPRDPSFVDGGVEVHAGDWLAGSTATVAGALAELVRQAPERGHLAVAAWLDPESDASVEVLRGQLALRAGLPTTFGWAPRSWAGDGPRHLADDTPDDAAVAGPGHGVHCHLTGGPPDDAPVPADAPGLTELDNLHAAQARAVVAALDERGRPVLRLHLTDRVAGLVTLARAIEDLPAGTTRPRR